MARDMGLTGNAADSYVSEQEEKIKIKTAARLALQQVCKAIREALHVHRRVHLQCCQQLIKCFVVVSSQFNNSGWRWKLSVREVLLHKLST
jgi:hypothetical protein